MKIIETQKVERAVTIGYKCDVCGAETKIQGNPWYTFTSFEPFLYESGTEEYDVCSPTCYIKQLQLCLDKLSLNSEDSEIDGKSYVFIQDLLSYLNQNDH